MLNRSASLAMSTSVLEALPGKLDVKRRSHSILYLSNHEIVYILTGFKNATPTSCHILPKTNNANFLCFDEVFMKWLLQQTPKF